jgi:hypothetical protein
VERWNRIPVDREQGRRLRRSSAEFPQEKLVKLGIEVAQSTVSIYMVPWEDWPLQTWKTFVRNHMEGIASFDLFVVPTIAFQQFFAFLVLGHRRQQLLWFAVIKNPMAEWLARQITEAFPWKRTEISHSRQLHSAVHSNSRSESRGSRGLE